MHGHTNKRSASAPDLEAEDLQDIQRKMKQAAKSGPSWRGRLKLMAFSLACSALCGLAAAGAEVGKAEIGAWLPGFAGLVVFWTALFSLLAIVTVSAALTLFGIIGRQS